MIRRRLVLAVTVTMGVAIVLASFLVVQGLEDRLIDDVDEEFANGSVNVDLRSQGFPARGERRAAFVERRRRVAVVQYDASGNVLASFASGTEDEPDPLPAAAGVDPADGIETVGSVGDGPRYRVLAVPGDAGPIAVGLSLADVDETLREARRIQLVVGVGAIAVVGVVSWLLIRRAFAPIDGMIATAGQIAEGDLDRRTAVEDPDTEVGRLASALNTMLDRIQVAVDEKSASEERMRRFVADASHDLRTPLTSVRGYAELYRQGATDPDDVAVGMERIEAEATRMSRLVDDLMLLARLDQEPEIERSPVDVGRLVGEAVDAARVIDDQRTYDLDAATGLTVAGDGDQLRQVFDNLLTNARTHTPTGTTVDVRVSRDGDDVLVVVDDDGPGFTEPDRRRAFDRFWRSTRADENPIAGAGLGLSIVRSIVEAHDGSIDLATSPAGGARFSIRLPTRILRPSP